MYFQYVLYMYYTCIVHNFKSSPNFIKLKLICRKFKTNKNFGPKLILQNKIIIHQAPTKAEMLIRYYKSMFFSPKTTWLSNQVHFIFLLCLI
jgi:hypothetical protein